MSVDQNDNTRVASEFLEEPAQAPVVKAEDLVGEGKPFKDVDALAYAKEMSNRHINTLEAETARLREEVTQLKDQGSMIEELKSEIMSTKSTDQTKVEPDPASVGEVVQEVDLTEQVRQVLAQTKQEDQDKSNLAQVRTTLVEKYGEHWSENFKRIAQENGLSDADLVGIATRSPQMFYKAAGLDVPAQVESNPLAVKGSVNTEAVVNSTGEVRNRDFYKQKRKELGADYYSSSWNAMELEDATKNPEWFN